MPVLAYAVFAAAIASTMGAYWYYNRDHIAGTTTPNRWSWLIWGATTIVEVLTFQAIAEGATWSEQLLKASVFYVSAACCLYLTVRIWLRSKWKAPNGYEIASVVASVIAIVIWLVFQEAWWAHLVTIAAIPISFIPSWSDAREDPEGEKTCAWALWTLGDALTLIGIVLVIDTDRELPYIVTELGCHAAMWLLVWRREITRFLNQ